MADHPTEHRHRSSPRHPRNPKYARKARPASLRFSRELEDLLQWEGLSRIENLDINDYGNTRSKGLGISDQDDVQIADMDEPADWQEFSELNTMLASAKRKLDLLEGNLRGARSSLFVPSLPSPASTTSFRSAAISSRHGATSSISSDEESTTQMAMRAQRVTSAPLQQLEMRNVGLKDLGHARYNSDSKVLQPRVTYIGSPRAKQMNSSPKSPRHHLHRTSMDLLREQSLDAVTEDKAWSSPRHTRQASSQTSVLSTQVLRTQAQVVRRSLQKLKRQSMDMATSSPSAASVRSEVRVLEATLSRQEEAITQLEEVLPQTPVSMKSHGSKASRMQRYIPAFDDDDDVFYDVPAAQAQDEEISELEEEDEEPYTEDAVDSHNEAASSLESSPENMDDGFDYETFILNNALGAYDDLPPLEKWSSRSTVDSATVPSPRQFLTEPSSATTERSSYDSEQSVQNISWPDPPAAKALVDVQQNRDVRHEEHTRGTIQPTAVDPVAATTQETPQHRLNTGSDQNAVSVILSALLSPLAAATHCEPLRQADQELLFTFATALRGACSQLGKSEGHDEDIRQRLRHANDLLKMVD